MLAGDVGGTKTLLAIFRVRNGSLEVVREKRLASDVHPSLGAMAAEFLAEGGEPVERACFAVAGPVVEGIVRPVNLPWEIVTGEVADTIGIVETEIVNDFRAVGFGLPFLSAGDFMTLQAGEPVPRGAIGLIGAGTGLGEAFLVWEAGRYRCYSSEGGHSSLSPIDDLQDRLARWLREQFDHVSFERAVSGPGLLNVYRFLVRAEGWTELPATRARMETEDPSAVVSESALRGQDPTCVAALDLFSVLYGVEAGNLALKVLATGGIYVAGGIAPKIAAKLADGSFLRGFHFKGRHASLMRTIPVRVVMNPSIGLRGAAAHATGLI